MTLFNQSIYYPCLVR